MKQQGSLIKPGILNRLVNEVESYSQMVMELKV